MGCCKVSALCQLFEFQTVCSSTKPESEMNKSVQTCVFSPFFLTFTTRCPGCLLNLVLLSEKALLRAVALPALLSRAQVATRPAVPALARGPLVACGAACQRTYCSLSSPRTDLYTAFASLTAQLASTWTAQESANVSRGWERPFKAFGAGPRWILGVRGDLIRSLIPTCFELLRLPCDSHECSNSVAFRIAYTCTFEGKYSLHVICD